MKDQNHMNDDGITLNSTPHPIPPWWKRLWASVFPPRIHAESLETMKIRLTCKSCFWFSKTHYGMGQCRLSAPVFHDVPPQHPQGDVPQRRWPRVLDDDWCGQWESIT